MDKWKPTTSVAYTRWRNCDLRTEREHMAGNGDSSASVEDDSRVSIGGLAKSSRSTPVDTKQETFTLDEALDALGFGRFQWKVLFLTGFCWSLAASVQSSGVSASGGRRHGDDDPEHPEPAAALRVAIGRLQGGSHHLGGVCRDERQLAAVGQLVGQVRPEEGADRLRLLDFLLQPVERPGAKFHLDFAAPRLGGLRHRRSSSIADPVLGIRPEQVQGLLGHPLGGFLDGGRGAGGPPGRVGDARPGLAVAGGPVGRAAGHLPGLLGGKDAERRRVSRASTDPFTCGQWLPESPRFDLLNGNVSKATGTLETMAKDNGKALPRGRLTRNVQPKERGRLADLFTRQHYKSTLLLCFIWFCFAFAYYGIILLTAEMFQSGDSCGVTRGAQNQPACGLECKSLTWQDYRDLLWTTFAEFPGLIVALGTVECLGRKKSMALPLFIFTLSILPLHACIGRTALTVCIFVGRAFISGGFQVVFVYTPEVFPTEIRALATGTCSAAAKVGALVTPFVAQVLLRHSARLTLAIYCLCSLLAGLACPLLPVETSGKALLESRDAPRRGLGQEALPNVPSGGAKVTRFGLNAK